MLFFAFIKKKWAVFLSLYKRWKLKIAGAFKILELYWGCRNCEYLQLKAQILFALVPNTHQLRWFISVWLRLLMWVQPLCHYLISLSLDWFSHKVGFQYYPYLQQGHKNRFLFFFFKYIRWLMSQLLYHSAL